MVRIIEKNQGCLNENSLFVRLKQRFQSRFTSATGFQVISFGHTRNICIREGTNFCCNSACWSQLPECGINAANIESVRSMCNSFLGGAK